MWRTLNFEYIKRTIPKNAYSLDFAFDGTILFLLIFIVHLHVLLLSR